MTTGSRDIVGSNGAGTAADESASTPGGTATKAGLHIQVEACLKIEPESIRGSEIARESKRSVSCHRPLAMHDLVYPTRRNADVLWPNSLA